jgi:AcrR family transcriptional regulator
MGRARSTAGGGQDGGAAAEGRNRGRADEILDIALRLFAEQGYTTVTIKDIARAGRINPALIYYYYHNKEDLFVAALKHAVAHALGRRRTLAQAESAADPATELALWFEANAKLAKPLGQMLRLMLDYRASRRRSTSIQRLIARFYEAEMSVLAQAIRRGVESGVFREVDTEKTALFVSTHLDGLVVAATIRADVDLKKALRQFQAILFDYLGHAPTAAGLRTVA